jgi:hypothetical protein
VEDLPLEETVSLRSSGPRPGDEEVSPDDRRCTGEEIEVASTPVCSTDSGRTRTPSTAAMLPRMAVARATKCRILARFVNDNTVDLPPLSQHERPRQGGVRKSIRE